MADYWKLLFSQDFMPHAHCYLGNQNLIWTMAVTDTLIGLAYIAITIRLYELVRKIRLPFSPMILCFALFIGACGLTHFMEVLNLWTPTYWLSAAIKVITASASVATAIFLIVSSKQIIHVAETARLSEKRAQEIKAQSEVLAQTNDQLSRAKERYRLLIDSVKDYALFAIDLHGYVSSWNTGAERANQYQEKEIIGRHFSCFYTQDDIDCGKPQSELREALEHGRFEEEGWRVKKDGTKFWASVVMTTTKDTNGEIIGFTKISRDITEKKNAEEERDKLIIAKQTAIESSKLKSEFLSAITHEIRTPINGIVGMSTLLHQTALTSQQGEFNNNISLSARNLLTIVTDILNFSQLEAGKVELEVVEFSFASLLEEIHDNVSSQAAAKAIGFVTDLEAGLPPEVRGDQGRIHHTLMNFLSNAVKFTQVGQIRLGISLVECRSDQSVFRFEVSDTGAGIPEEFRKQLFLPFNHVDNSAHREFGGMGLGLSTSKRIVELMDGEIGVDNNAGGGSTFWFTVPLEVKSHAKKLAPIIPLHRKKEVKILIAEDNLVNQKITLIMLKKLGYDADTALDGSEAFEKIKNSSYDLIFMDCQMPKVDGYEATRLIRTKSGRPHIPIVALTTNSLAGDREKCLECGMNDYLSKPASLKALEQIIEKWAYLQAA